MKKILLFCILSLGLAQAQGQIRIGVINDDTLTRPTQDLGALAWKNSNLYVVKPSGNTSKILQNDSRLWVGDDNRVGIGTKAPTQLFEVAGNAKIGGSLQIGVGAGFLVANSSGLLSSRNLEATDIPYLGNYYLDMNSGGFVNGEVEFRNNISLSAVYDNGTGTHSLQKDGNALRLHHIFQPTNGMIAPTQNLNILNVVGSKIGVNVTEPNADVDVAGSLKVSGNFELGDILDVRTAINSKLNTSTATATYALKNNATLTGTTEFAGNATVGDGFTLTVAGLLNYNNFPAPNTTILGNSVGDMAWGKISDAYVATTANIDASKLGTGIISNAEFNFLNNVSSNLQTQLDSKLSSATAASTYVALTGNQTITGTKAFSNIQATTSDIATLNVGTVLKLPIYAPAQNVFLRQDGTTGYIEGQSVIFQSDVQNLTTDLAAKAPINNANFTGTFSLGGTVVSTNATRLNYLGSATGTTGTTSSNIVFSNSPTLVTPNLGTPSTITLTNATGLPVSGLSGLGTGVATFLGTPTSANFATAITDETGTGSVVLHTSPVFATGITSPILHGSSSTTGTLRLNSSSSASATTGSDILFGFGTTENVRFFQGGNVRIGSGGSSSKRLVLHGSGSESIKIESSTNANYRGVEIGDASATYSSIMQRLDTGELKMETGFTGWGGFQSFYTNGTEKMRIQSNGNVGIGTAAATSRLQVVGLPVYADNAAATSGGLTAGAFYRTSTGVLMVVY